MVNIFSFVSPKKMCKNRHCNCHCDCICTRQRADKWRKKTDLVSQTDSSNYQKLLLLIQLFPIHKRPTKHTTYWVSKRKVFPTKNVVLFLSSKKLDSSKTIFQYHLGIITRDGIVHKANPTGKKCLVIVLNEYSRTP